MSDLETIKLELVKVSSGLALSMIINIVLYLLTLCVVYYYIHKYVCEELDKCTYFGEEYGK